MPAVFLYFGSLSSLWMTMSSSTNETRNSLQICNECNEQIELFTSRTTKNPNYNFWKCRGCKKFEWEEDHKCSEEKIDLLVEEVKKLALEIEWLSVKFQLCKAQRGLFNDELRRRQTPCYDLIRIHIIILLCFIFENFF